MAQINSSWGFYRQRYACRGRSCMLPGFGVGLLLPAIYLYAYVTLYLSSIYTLYSILHLVYQKVHIGYFILSIVYCAL